MDKITTILVEDETNNLNLQRKFIQNYCPLIEIVGEAQDCENAITLIEKLKPKLIFLDIILPDGTGFTILDQVSNYGFKVVFVTSHDEFAVKAFKYNAFDFLLKPLIIEDLIITVNKVFSEIRKEFYTSHDQILHLISNLNNEKKFDFIAVSSLDNIKFVKLENILYLESDGRYTIFHMKDQKNITSTKNLGEYVKILDPGIFFRIHRSYIVNLKHVNKISKKDGGYCVLSNNSSIPVSRRKKEDLLRFLNLK